jgi:hypothetical protein
LAERFWGNRKEAPMAKWEYKVIADHPSMVEKAINQLADKGWEVVSSAAYAVSGTRVSSYRIDDAPPDQPALVVILRKERGG